MLVPAEVTELRVLSKRLLNDESLRLVSTNRQTHLHRLALDGTVTARAGLAGPSLFIRPALFSRNSAGRGGDRRVLLGHVGFETRLDLVDEHVESLGSGCQEAVITAALCGILQKTRVELAIVAQAGIRENEQSV